MRPYLYLRARKEYNFLGLARRLDERQPVLSLLRGTNYASERSVRLLVVETKSGIGHSDLYDRSLLGFGTTDGKFFFQIAYMTIFF
jgi:hypothetical protein